MIVFIYNLFQIATWSAVLALLIYYGTTLSSYDFVRLYHRNQQFRLLFEVAQGTQIFDFIFACLRMTRNNPLTVFSQITSRLYCLWLIFPYVPEPGSSNEYSNYYIIQIVIASWCQAEIIRFTFYSFKGMQAGLIGHLRYNMFLLFYPLGVGAELVCMWAAWRAVQAIPLD